MNKDAGFNLISITCGVFIVLFVVNFLPGSLFNSAKKAMNECEKTLPRNQHCIITAIPAPQNDQ